MVHNWIINYIISLILFFFLFSRSITLYVLLSFLTLYYDICSDKPVCHGGAKGILRLSTIYHDNCTFYYGLLRPDGVSCVLTKA